jgi:hypothetical protein
VCPAASGECEPRLVPTGSGSTDAFPECDFELSPGDDFACRVNLATSSLNLFLFGQTFSGLGIFEASEVQCAGAAP